MTKLFWWVAASSLCGTLGCAAGKPIAEKPAEGDLAAKLDAVVKDAFAKREMPGGALVVVRGNRVIYSAGHGYADIATKRPYTDTSTTVIGSTSKPLTALGVLRLVQLGKVALDAPIARYLPDLRFRDPRGTAITVRHLLNNRSGIVAGFSGDAYADPPIQDAGAVERIARESATYPLVFAPGQGYLYSNRGWLLLGYLIQRVANEPVETFMRRVVFEPLGMTQTTLEFWKAPGMVTGYEEGYQVRNRPRRPSLHRGYGPSGMTASTPADMGRLLMAMLNQGKTALGTQFLTPELIAEAVRPQADAESELGGPTRYGLGWEVDSTFGSLTIKKAGSVGTMVTLWVMLPEQQLGLAFAFNREDYQVVPVVKSVLTVLAGGTAQPFPSSTWTPPARPTGVATRPGAAQRWLGTYDTHSGDTKIYRRGDSLFTDYEAGEAALVAANDSSYWIVDDIVKHAGKSLDFRRQGKAITLWSGKDSLGLRVTP